MLNERGIAHLEQTRAIGGDEVVGIVERVLCDIHEVAYGQAASLAREQAIGDIGYGKGWGMLKDEFETKTHLLSCFC